MCLKQPSMYCKILILQNITYYKVKYKIGRLLFDTSGRLPLFLPIPVVSLFNYYSKSQKDHSPFLIKIEKGVAAWQQLKN